jgi:hypothetical protein
LLFADKPALLAALGRDDPPMHFYRTLDTMPGYTGVGLPASAAPPPDAVRVDGIIDLANPQTQGRAQLKRDPNLLVATAPGMGAFSAAIPVEHAASVATRCWVVLRLRVLSGRVAFAAFDNRTGIIARTPAIAKGPDLQTIALPVSDFRSATHIVIFNDSTLPAGGLVDVLDAFVLVPKEQAAR